MVMVEEMVAVLARVKGLEMMMQMVVVLVTLVMVEATMMTNVIVILTATAIVIAHNEVLKTLDSVTTKTSLIVLLDVSR